LKLSATLTKQLGKLIEGAEQILILSPDFPDLDSVSSNIALAKTFVGMGKQVRLLSSQPLKNTYAWIDWSDRYMTKEDMKLVRRDKPDLVVISDASGRSMFREILEEDNWLLDETPVLLIDHHQTEADYPVALGIIEPIAAATGELLYYLYNAMNWDITPEQANLMLAGIAFDTNRFENSNVDYGVLHATAELVKLGGNFYEVTQAILSARAYDETKFKTIAKIEQSAVVMTPIAYLAVPFADINHLKANTSLVKPLVESLRTIKDVRVSFVLVEKDDKSLILSFRSQPGIDVAKVAEHFGGGGHAVAASARITGMDMTDAVVAVLQQLEPLLEAK
jgi:phosphoesterase RecJ-like protein